ncbi:hypothetical protein ACOMHN_035414 [Nucella lapillus]
MFLPVTSGTYSCSITVNPGNTQTSCGSFTISKPRSTTAVPVPPKVNFINKPVTAAFDLEAFPLPDNFTFQYLGSTENSSNSQPVSASIELRAECSNTYADFAVRCIVSVDKAKDSTAEGFYIFTAANAFGEEQFVFQVTLNANSEKITDDGVNAAAIGGGLATGLIVIIVVVLVCYCCRRRQMAPQWGTADSDVITQSSLCLAQQWGTADSDVITQSSLCLAPQWGTADSEKPANRGPSGSAYEDVMTEPGRNPQIISGPQPGPSASGEDNVYSVVNKPKKTSPAPPPAAGDDANVYYVVDKNKKAPALPPPPLEAGPSNAGKAKPAAKPKPEGKK